MPTYTYKCKNCQIEFEKFQKINSESLKTCPSCNTESLIRVIDGGAGLIFRGNGFYITDYKNSKTSNSGKKDTAVSQKKSTEDTKTTT